MSAVIMCALAKDPIKRDIANRTPTLTIKCTNTVQP